MTPQIYKYIAITVLLFATELVYFWIARRCNITDHPNLRSSHIDDIIRGGGIIFPLAILFQQLFFSFSYFWFIIGLLLIAVVSYIDDIRSLPDSVRLIAQTSACLLLLYQLDLLHMNLWWLVAIGLILCVGIINAYNFMDGINGITGAYSLAVLVPLIVVNHTTPFIDLSYLITASIACIVFCFFNFRKKALSFAGDVGSISMAFIVIFPLAKLMIQVQDFSYIVFLALYGVDTVLTICHRIMLHENLGQAHRKHAFQIMANELRIPHVVVSAAYAITQILISLGLILFYNYHIIYTITILLFFGFAYIFFIKRYYPLHEQYLKSLQTKND